MIVDLTDTTASQIDNALLDARHRLGAVAAGIVCTLVLVVDERTAYDALRAANVVARAHPSRVLAVILRSGSKGSRVPARLDAEVRVGDETGLAETVLMRLYGPLGAHPDSVVLPLLLPDAPVIAWWPGGGPERPADDPVGRLAGRRVTDAAAASRPLTVLAHRAATYCPGDTDLAWSRVTRWRTLIAAALDQPYDPIIGGEVSAVRSSPSAELLAAWLSWRLGVDIERKASRGPGITGLRLDTEGGPISITRPDGRVATLSRPGMPDRPVALRQRETPDILSEELRRLDPDEVYAETLRHVRAPEQEPPG
jgi:glucose-6-phosphate dehydrogenase assembly protein OpcA